ncbi:MAG: cytochrome c biogenesis protein [Opitutales bacterium]
MDWLTNPWVIGYTVLALLVLPIVGFVLAKPVVRRAYRWPFAVVGTILFLIVLYGVGLRPKAHPTAMDVERFAEIPVQYQGRLMPIDTAARSTLRLLRQKETVETASGDKLQAIDWLLWVMAKPKEASQLPVFRIDHPQVRTFFNLPENGKFASYADLWDRLPAFEQALQVLPPESQDFTTYERNLAKLASAVKRYNDLGMSFHPGVNRPDVDSMDLVRTYQHWGQLVKEAAAAASKTQSGESLLPRETAVLALLRGVIPIFERMQDPTGRLLVVPPSYAGAEDKPEQQRFWSTIGGSLLGTFENGTVDPATADYATVILAYNEGDVAAFDAAVERLHAQAGPAAEEAAIGLEEAFNRASPFYVGSGLYVIGMLLVFAGWLRWSEGFRQTAFWLLVLTFGLHSAALLARMIIMDRPAPVTNLYSSAIFIGWAACGLGLLLEQVFKNSFGLLTAGVIGFLTLVIAHNLDNSGDTMEAMRAVLDSNFWLATHVVTITLGYVPMFVAGTIATVYLFMGIFTSALTKDIARTLTRTVYGVLAFALILTFIGTMLGGIWADQSWGRFWGWDPKENGALMIVLWVALTLHARLGGLVRERGIMLLAVAGGMITAWSWFGTNQLGIGLHSYGFTDSGHNALLGYWGSQLLVILVGLTPLRFWRSAQQLKQSGTELRPRPVGEKVPAGTPQTQSA